MSFAFYRAADERFRYHFCSIDFCVNSTERQPVGIKRNVPVMTLFTGFSDEESQTHCPKRTTVTNLSYDYNLR